jgi:urease beta subunit
LSDIDESGGAAPRRVAPGGVTPSGVVTGEVVPGRVVPGGIAPGGAVPGRVVPGGAVPGGVVPGGVVPGEVIVAPGPAPVAAVTRRQTVMVANRGRFDAYLTSHFPVVRASPTLEFPRTGLDGARPRLPAGASVRIPRGETVAVELIWD